MQETQLPYQETSGKFAAALAAAQTTQSAEPGGINPDYDGSPEAEIRRLMSSRDRARRERDDLRQQVAAMRSADCCNRVQDRAFAYGLKVEINNFLWAFAPGCMTLRKADDLARALFAELDPESRASRPDNQEAF